MQKCSEQNGKGNGVRQGSENPRETIGTRGNKATRNNPHGTILARPEQTHFVKSIRNRSIRRERVSWPGRAFYFRESETRERERNEGRENERHASVTER